MLVICVPMIQFIVRYGVRIFFGGGGLPYSDNVMGMGIWHTVVHPTWLSFFNKLAKTLGFVMDVSFFNTRRGGLGNC